MFNRSDYIHNIIELCITDHLYQYGKFYTTIIHIISLIRLQYLIYLNLYVNLKI